MDTRVRRGREAARRPEQVTHDEVVHVMASGFGVDEDKRETIAVRKFVTEPAYVRVSAGTTKNMGNYESLRVDVAISVPCYVEEIDEVVGRVTEEVARRLDDELEAYGTT